MMQEIPLHLRLKALNGNSQGFRIPKAIVEQFGLNLLEEYDLIIKKRPGKKTDLRSILGIFSA